MVAISCPSCGDTESIVRFGYNRSGTERLRCRACGRCFTPNGKSRAITPEKEKLIENCLAERMSQYGIARALGVSRDTVRKVRKKGHNGS
jgi:transposase-like protein